MPEDLYTRVLNRKPRAYDHRDLMLRDFITPAMRKRAALISQMDWEVNKILDQGNTGHCVGFAWAGFGISLPVQDQWGNDMGDKLYYLAKIFDGEPQAENGSSTLSGVKAFMEQAYLEGNTYAWASSVDDIVTWIKTKGPVIVGTNWYTQMFYPNPNGLIKIGGIVEGGHEWEVSGWEDATGLFHCTNSWGEGFGLKGQFYISLADLQRLLNEQGDAVTACEINPTPAPVPVPTPTPTPVPAFNFWKFLKDLAQWILNWLAENAYSKNRSEH